MTGRTGGRAGLVGRTGGRARLVGRTGGRAGLVGRTRGTGWPGRAVVVLLGVLAGLLLAGPARAHVGGDLAGSDFDGRVLSVSPPVPGVTVRVLSFGDEVELVNRGDTDVLVPGYSDEAYLRIGPQGVWRNANSPATYVNLDRFGRATLPPGVAPSAPPRWERVSSRPQYVWHDHRTHWMSADTLPPMVAADPTRPHLVFRWSFPLLLSGDAGELRSTVTGELTWSPPPSPWVVWPLYLAGFGAVAAAGVLARTPRPLGGALVAVALAGVWHAVSTPPPPVTVASHTGALISALLPAGLLLLLAVVGARAALRGRGALTGLAAVVLGWLALVVGLPDVDTLWSAHVLAAGPQLPARIAVAVLVAGGAGCGVGGIAAVRRFRDRGRALPAGYPASMAQPVSETSPGGSARLP